MLEQVLIENSGLIAQGGVGSFGLLWCYIKIRTITGLLDEMRRLQEIAEKRTDKKISDCVIKELCLLQHRELTKEIRAMDSRNEKGHDTIFNELRTLQKLILEHNGKKD